MEIDVDKVWAGIREAASIARNEEELRIRVSNIIMRLFQNLKVYHLQSMNTRLSRAVEPMLYTGMLS